MNLVTPDSGLLFWMVIIFGIVFFILWKFGFPIITDMVEKRSAHIDESLKLAQEAEKRMQDLAREQAELIEKTRLEQNRILKDATQSRAAIIAKAEEEAAQRADKLLEKARTEIAAEKESALRDIRLEVARLSVGIAEKVIRKDLSTDEAQMQYLDRLVDEAAAPKD
ncbi:MAG: F0F1 ATP synthase subunit B [Bacteroidales bacterium]|nr:F0F1 ATP synthase subunit B [Bacteroidales bacterium]